MSEKTPTTASSPSGDFHTQANLTQTLNTIALEHFKSTHKSDKGKEVALPQFMAEALHMTLSNIAGAINGDPFYETHWRNAGEYSLVVANILRKAKKDKEAAKKEAVEKEKTNGQNNSDITLEEVK